MFYSLLHCLRALGGDLHRHCVALDTDEPSSSRSEKEVVYLLRQILEGLKHLHNQNYVHLDIKVCEFISNMIAC